MLPAARQHVLLAAGWEGSERFLGARGTSVPQLRPGHAAVLRTGYTVPEARIPCGEPLPSACACLAPSCQCSGLFQQQVVHLWACVRVCVPAVVSVRILVYHTSPSPTPAPLPRRTWSDQLHHLSCLAPWQ